MSAARGSFKVESWDEHPVEDFGHESKVTRASVEQTFAGDLAGKGAVEWTMAYRPDGTADFVGLQRFTGSIGGHEGTCVMRSTGTFDGKLATGHLVVLEGVGSGSLTKLAGEGTFEAPLGGEASFTLDLRAP